MNGQHYLPLTDPVLQEMLASFGAASIEDLFRDIPPAIQLTRELDLPPSLSEPEALAHLRHLAAKNMNLEDYTCFLGAGAYDHYIPSAVRHLTHRSEFYTAYTPYQAEISQGILQAIFEYQTLICQLTGLDVANASLYDGASALAEGAVMACGATGKRKVLVSRGINPQYRQVLKSYLEVRGLEVNEVLLTAGGQTNLDEALRRSEQDPETAALLLQTPNFFGVIEEPGHLADTLHEHGTLLVVSVDPISLPLLKTPGEYGADIATGEGQALGNPLSMGGPYLGFLAARENLLRRLPGRIVGETRDASGLRGYVLTLQTREQHIRRERATSNICSNQALNALTAAVYMALMGPEGMKTVAGHCLQKAAYAREQICALPGYELIFPGVHFKEFAVTVTGSPGEMNEYLLQHGIIGPLDLEQAYPELPRSALFCVTEKRSKAEIDTLVRVLEGWK